MADHLYESASCRTARIDENVEDTMWAGYRDRHHQASPSAVSADAFLDVHEAIGPINRLDEATERRRSLDAFGDCVDDSWAVGTDTRKVLGFCLGRYER